MIASRCVCRCATTPWCTCGSGGGLWPAQQLAQQARRGAQCITQAWFQSLSGLAQLLQRKLPGSWQHGFSDSRPSLAAGESEPQQGRAETWQALQTTPRQPASGAVCRLSRGCQPPPGWSAGSSDLPGWTHEMERVTRPGIPPCLPAGLLHRVHPQVPLLCSTMVLHAQPQAEDPGEGSTGPACQHAVAGHNNVVAITSEPAICVDSKHSNPGSVSVSSLTCPASHAVLAEVRTLPAGLSGAAVQPLVPQPGQHWCGGLARVLQCGAAGFWGQRQSAGPGHGRRGGSSASSLIALVWTLELPAACFQHYFVWMQIHGAAFPRRWNLGLVRLLLPCATKHGRCPDSGATSLPPLLIDSAAGCKGCACRHACGVSLLIKQTPFPGHGQGLLQWQSGCGPLQTAGAMLTSRTGVLYQMRGAARNAESFHRIVQPSLL